MTLVYQTRTARELAEDARDRKDELRNTTWDMLNLMTRLLDLGVPRGACADALDALIEPIAEADTYCNRYIEEIKEWFEPIDLNEARAMRDGLKVVG